MGVRAPRSTPSTILPPPAGSAGGSGDDSGGVGDKLLSHIQDHLRVNSARSKSNRSYSNVDSRILQANFLQESLLPHGLPSTDLLKPQIDMYLKSVDFVETLADVYKRIKDCPQFERSGAYLEQCAVFKGLFDPKLFRRSLRSARQHAVDVHTKIELSAWLRYERREDELHGSTRIAVAGTLSALRQAWSMLN